MKKVVIIIMIIAMFTAVFASIITIDFSRTLCCCYDTYYMGADTETISVSPYTTSMTVLLNE